ncbi:hypothetical protein HY493_04360 [Candidatus Woesearchaeota archaeon]|nr:hypothetical protein [Candidatus Woesearchaeota archaeon]
MGERCKLRSLTHALEQCGITEGIDIVAGSRRSGESVFRVYFDYVGDLNKFAKQERQTPRRMTLENTEVICFEYRGWFAYASVPQRMTDSQRMHL